MSLNESRNQVASYIEHRNEEYECPSGHVPMANAISMIASYSVPFNWTDAATSRSFDEHSDPPEDWIDLTRFTAWKTRVVEVLMCLWSTMEEHGFNKNNANRLREVCIYVLYKVKTNRVLSIGNTVLIKTCPPILDFLPHEEVLSGLPNYHRFRGPYDAQQVTSGKAIFTNFFADLMKKNPTIKSELEQAIDYKFMERRN